MVCEPHSGIISQMRAPTLDLTAKESTKTRDISTELVQGGYNNLMKDIKIIRRHATPLSNMISLEAQGGQYTFLQLEDKEFQTHPVVFEDFSKSAYLEKIFSKACDVKPDNYEELLSLEGVGPKTMRALSLVSEVIYGARPSYEDPARYSFAHGGKDFIPYPVDRATYDSSIEFFTKVVQKMKVAPYEKRKMLARLAR